MMRLARWHNKALLSDNFSAAPQICRRARRYVNVTSDARQIGFGNLVRFVVVLCVYIV